MAAITYSAVYASKPSWLLIVDVWETSIEPWNNQSYVNWAVSIQRGNSDTPFNDQSSAWSLAGPGGINANFNPYRFGGSGSGTDYSGTPVGNRVQLGTGGAWVARNADGSGSVNISAVHIAGGTLGTATLSQQTFQLDKLTQAPGQPSAVALARNSDTQATLTWGNNYPTNGAPTSNEIDTSVNDSAFGAYGVTSISPSGSLVVSTTANMKVAARVREVNSVGTSAWSVSGYIYTTPGAPTNVVATKAANGDISITFTENVAYNEYEHEVWHGTVSGGVTTWDANPLTTLGSGVLSYIHTAPSTSQVHTYRVRAKAGSPSLYSAYANSGSVQLLAAPNAPTFTAPPAYADKASALDVAWVHNSVDTSPQSAYEFSYSTNGGTNWTSSGKVASTVAKRTLAANTFAANAAVTMRVRTWGAATTGGSDGTGASAWSSNAVTTFKTVPTATITTPAAASTYTDATLRVTLGFSQPEAATFVKATVQLLQGATVLETLSTSALNGIVMKTPLQNAVAYSVKAQVQDSNGLWSAWVTNAFSVSFQAPVPAGVAVTFLPATGFGQLDLTIPAPGTGQAAAATVTITRTINGVVETVVQDYPVSAALTFLDTVPVVNGTNTYSVTTKSALGAQTTVTKDLVTAELRRAYLAKGSGYSNVVVFGANLKVQENLNVASDTVQAAGRIKPIGLYGVETAVQVKVDTFIYEGFGSTVDQMRSLILVPGKGCYRDASGRRVFGTVQGLLKYSKGTRADVTFTVTETS